MGELLHELYTEYSKDIYRYFYGLTLDAGLAEDLTADTFLEAVRSLHTFRAESGVKTWLFSLARHRWFHYLRKKKTQPQTVSDPAFFTSLLTDDGSVEKTVADRAVIDRIREILQQLSPQANKVMTLRMNGYSYYEIAAELKISENSARVIEFRVRTRIKKMLNEEGFTDE